MTSIDSEAPPIPKQIYLRTSNLTSDSLDSENDCRDTFLKMDAVFDPFFAEMDNNADSLPGSMSKNASDANANLENSAAAVNRHLFPEPPQENGSDIAHDMEYLLSSSEENTINSTKNSLDYSPLSPNRNGDVLFESADEQREETFTISCQPDESLGLVLGMNEIIDSSAREVRKVYVKKISLKGAMIRAMNETNTIRLGDEILAINETQIKSLSRTECLNLLIDLPNKITFLLRRNTVPWTTGPRCSFYLNLVDKNPESILSPAPKLFTNEGKKIPDGYKLLEVSLYREVSDLLGISIVPSYGHTRHYYQIKEFDSDGICFKSKLLNKGDFLVSCNGNSLYKIPLNQCLNILKSEGPSLTFEVFRKDDSQTVLESQETRPIYGDTSEVNNNVNDNNDNEINAVRSENCLASELLVATEIRPSESVRPLLKTNTEDILFEQTVLERSDPKLFSNSTDISKFSNSDSNTSSDFNYPQILELETGKLNTSHLSSDSQALLKSSVNHSEPSLDIDTSPDLLELSNADHKKFPDTSDSTSVSELNKSDSKLLPDFGHSPQLIDLNSSDSKPSTDISDSTEIFKSNISDFKPLPDFNDSSNLLKFSNGELKTSSDFSDSAGTLELINSDSQQSQLISISPDLLESRNCDSHTSQTIGDLPKLSQWNGGDSKPLSNFFDSHDLSRFEDADSQPHTDIIDSKIPNSHSSSLEFELKENLSKPLLDFLTGSPSVGSSNGLQEPINACPAEPSPPPVVDDTCVQLTTEAVQSSPTTDWSSQLNMSEQSLDEEHFSLDGLAEFSNHLNNANELNNNFSTSYPCSSNEDLISIDADVLSPVISNPTLTYSNHAHPWEAAGEAKSETLLPELQRPQSANQKNALNEFIDTVESPDYGSDPLDSLHDNIIQVVRDDKTLQSRPTNFHSDVSKGFNARLSSNTSLCSDLVEEERTSPMSYDDSFYGSTGIHTTDESDIPLSSRNSDNDLIEEMSALSPDSGMADSSGENFYDRENFIQKGPPLNLECSNASDDPDKLTDEETTLYHTISDVSKNAKVSGKHGSFDSSSDSCGTSVGSFESCAETGEQDHFSTNNSKPFNSKNEETTQMKQTKSLPRNAFSDFKEFQNSMKISSKLDTKLFSFSEIRASTLTMNPSRSDLNTFSTNLFSRKQRHERKSDQVRTEDKPFQVEVLKGIIGLGMTLKADDQGFVKVTHIQNNSPIGRNGIIKVGDCILEINNTDTVGVDDSRMQQILRLLPRGLIKVVASAVPITDWKKYTEGADDPSAGKSDKSLFGVSLTSPIKMPESFRSNLSGSVMSMTPQKKPPSSSFSSALSAFSKDPSPDSAKRSAPLPPPPPPPQVAPKLSQKKQSVETEIPVKSSAFLKKESPPLDKKQTNHNLSYEPSPLNSPEIVLNQVKMFENYFQKKSTNSEIKEQITSSKQKLVETIPSRNQKHLPEKECKESLPDILQNHSATLKSQEIKNATVKTITNSYDAVSKTTSADDCGHNEDIIMPVKSNRYKTFSALPKSSAPRILDSFSMWDGMDSKAMQNQNKVPQLKKTADLVSLPPKDVVIEDVIVPKKKSFVQSLVNQFNSSQDVIRSSSSKISYASPERKELKAPDEESIKRSPKSTILEETIEPMKSTRIRNMPKPMPISFSDIFDIDEVLIIENSDKPNTEPNLKMTFKGPYHADVEVSEPVLKPEKKTLSKSLKKPVASPRASSVQSSSKISEENGINPEVNTAEPEVCIGIARRLPQSGIPDCIDIMKIPETVPTAETNLLEEHIIPQVKANVLEKYIETSSKKRAKALLLLGIMDDDGKCTSSLESSQKPELNGMVSDRIEVNEEEIISCIKDNTAMSAKPRKILSPNDASKKPETLKETHKSQNQNNFGASNSKDFNCQPSDDSTQCSLKVVEMKAEVIVNDIINASQKELSQKNSSDTETCDITEHINVKTDSSAQICADTKAGILKDDLEQKFEPESYAKISPPKFSAPKRNLPLIENGKPKPLPRQSRQLLPSDETNTTSEEKLKITHRSLPYPTLKSEISASLLEADVELSNSSLTKSSPVPFQRSVSPSGRLKNLSERDSIKNVNFSSAPSSPMQEQKPPFFKRTSTSCLESLLNSELQTPSNGRFFFFFPGHYVSRCLPCPPTTLEEYKPVGRSLPPVPAQSSVSSVFGNLIDFKSRTWEYSPTSIKTVTLSVQPQDDSSNTSSSLKITNSSDASSATSPESYLETNPTEEKSVAPSSPVLFTKTVSQFTNTTTKVETPSSPVAPSFQQSSTFWSDNKQMKQQAPLIEKSSVSPSSAVKVLPVGEPKLPSALAKTSFSVTLSDSLDGVVEDKPKAVVPSSPTSPSKNLSNEFDPSKVISVEMPGSPVTKLPDVQEENSTSSLSMNTWSSNRSVIPENDTKSLILSSPVSQAKAVIENQAPLSPTASRPTLHLESMPSDSDQTSPTSLSPRRIANRKLPDIFQSSHTFRSPSSPSKMRTFSEISTPSETVKSIQEHKSQKVVEVSNSEVALSRSISVEPKTASNLTDLKLKSHSIEIIDATHRTEVAVSQTINVEPRKSLDLSEVKVEKLTAQVMEGTAKLESVSMQFSDVKPKSMDNLSERKAKTGSAAFVEDIAKPQVAVSQFIGIKPTTASNLSTKELKDKNTSRPATLSMENAGSPKKQEQNIEVFAEVTSPKTEVAVSKSISLQPATATGLSEPVKRSRVSDIKKEPTKSLPSSSSSTTTTTVKARLASMKSTDVVTSSDSGRPSFLRHKSTDGVILRCANTETNTSSSQDQPYGRKVSRYAEKARPKTEIFSKDMPSVFSKRKWCISTKSGQTNFAVPSEPESIDKVIQLGLIDEDDLDRLLTNANFALDKMSFSNKEEIHIAILEKDATEKIGIRLKKGEKQELLISLLEPDGAAVKQNFIHIGDALLLVNGKPAWNQTVMDVKVWLQTIETRIILVLCRHPMNEEETANDCEYLDIILHKGVTGIGFCLEGGIGCPLGDRPISVKRIFKGGPAEKDGQLKVGDEILKVNDMDFQKQRHFIAWNHLKFLPVGDVKLHICRRKSQAPKSTQIQDTSTEPEADPSA